MGRVECMEVRKMAFAVFWISSTAQDHNHLCIFSEHAV